MTNLASDAPLEAGETDTSVESGSRTSQPVPLVANSGRFIVFEGGDGAGKSTHTQLLAAWLVGQGKVVRQTFEPGDTAIGATIRRLVLEVSSGDVAPRAEALLYAADKAQHIYEVVGPALGRGEIVICDRYTDSMVAYQGAGRVLNPSEIAQIATWGTLGVKPDLTIVLDVPVAEGVDALAEHDRLERAGSQFHERVRAFFLVMAESDPSRYLVVDARQPKEVTAAAIRRRVAELLGISAD